MRAQVRIALEESDLVLFVIDGREGPTWMDEDVADMLRRSGKPVIVVANKIDDGIHEDLVHQAYSLGFGEVIGVSAEHKRNIFDLLWRIVRVLPEEREEEAEEGVLSVAIVGKPNVGKSSILNFLAGTERSLVSDIPGTTRDAVDTLVEFDGTVFRLIDTAGMRRKSRMESDVEYYSFVRTLQAIDRCDVALLVMDASDPFTDQDKDWPGDYRKEQGNSSVLNKWDLWTRAGRAAMSAEEIRDECPFSSLSELHVGGHRQRVHKLPGSRSKSMRTDRGVGGAS